MKHGIKVLDLPILMSTFPGEKVVDKIELCIQKLKLPLSYIHKLPNDRELKVNFILAYERIIGKDLKDEEVKKLLK